MAECPNHHTHTFNFNELEVGSGSNQQPYFRALVFFYKKPGLTDEFFHEHWKSVHADLTLSTKDAGVNLVRYVQVRRLIPESYRIIVEGGRSEGKLIYATA